MPQRTLCGIAGHTRKECMVSGGPSGTSSEGDVHPTSASGTTSQAIVNSGNAAGFYSWLAVGV